MAAILYPRLQWVKGPVEEGAKCSDYLVIVITLLYEEGLAGVAKFHLHVNGFSIDLYVHLQNINLCEVICKNLPYRGTNSVILDQLFSHVCDSTYG